MDMKKIAIVGPESTGKSTLSAQLAEALHTVWVPEFARTYLQNFEGHYQLHDLEAIADGQLKLQQSLETQANQFLICDTTLLVIEVWAEHAFGQCPEWIKNAVRNQAYALTFLTNIDMPWEPDPLREHPHLREHFMQVYTQKLIEIGTPFHILSGTAQVRLSTALQWLAQL
jgi:NadR type nicotinamide-nucleotide adenylyltransferase